MSRPITDQLAGFGWGALALVTLCGCQPQPVQAPVQVSPSSDQPSETEPQPPTPALNLIALGTSYADLLARYPDCSELEDAAMNCRRHGSVELPLSAQCEDGCTWWSYGFSVDGLDSIILDRSVYDVDEAFVREFTSEAVAIAAALDRQLGPSSAPEDLARWSEIEADPNADRQVLQRRVWTIDDVTTLWELAGIPGHHPGIQLRIEVAPHSKVQIPRMLPSPSGDP